ncbi:hypothetical protein HC928_00365 [bacterium]|nr:hypothetical protein [bacterium]
MTAADWDFNLLESLIQDRGDSVIWETALACPACRREDSTASFNEVTPTEATRIRKVNCDTCEGLGFIYRNATMVKGLLTQINAGNRQLIDVGLVLPGDCVFSPSLNACEIHDMDKITLCVSDVLHEGQVIQRNAARLSFAKQKTTSLKLNEDRLWYNGDGTAIWCEDENNVVYDVGTDFVIQDNVIRWVARKPADGVFYTLKYSYYPEWIVYASPLQRIDRGRSLQQRVVLRKKHIVNMNATTTTPGDRQAEQLELTGRIKI